MLKFPFNYYICKQQDDRKYRHRLKHPMVLINESHEVFCQKLEWHDVWGHGLNSNKHDIRNYWWMRNADDKDLNGC